MTPARDIRLLPAGSAADLQAARTLFTEYARSLDVDLGFQDFAAEIATLPGAFAPPGGAVLLARVDGEPAACGAFRPCPHPDHPHACEMKRLYARPAFRGLGLGRTIAQALMARARAAGYEAMLLDTLEEMSGARGLYASLGFREIPAYYDNPLAGVHYLKANLG